MQARLVLRSSRSGTTPPARTSSALLQAIAIFLLSSLGLFAASGCGKGGGGSHGTPGGSELNGVASNVTPRDLGGGRVEVQFTLSAPGPREIETQVEYSENRGLSYSGATLEQSSGSPAALPANPGGVRHALVWKVATDLQDLSQQDLRVRITPFDSASRAPGISAESGVFGMGPGMPPRITSVTAPSGPNGGWVSLQYVVTDPDGDYVSVEGEYSLDGVTYRRATLGGGDGAAAVAAPPEGAAHAVSWHAQADAPEAVRAAAWIKLRAVDTSTGSFASSGAFALDTRAPAIGLLTLESIPRAMNGSTSFRNLSGQDQEFRLLSPDHGFTVWIAFVAGGSDVDRQGVRVASAQPLGGGAGAGGVDGGSDFGNRFSVDLSDGVALWSPGPELAFPFGPQEISARIRDVLGNESSPVSFRFETGPATAARRPFEGPEQWRLDFSRDNFAISSTIDQDGTVTVTASQGANGIPDFVEDLRILGLQSASPPPAAMEARLNELVLGAVQESVRGIAGEVYGRRFDGSPGPASAAVEFTLGQPGGPHSRIGIGGEDPLPGYTLGRAEFDYRNSIHNDELDADLGVFTTNLIDFYINSSHAFRTSFNPFIPGRGVPLGFHADDTRILGPGFQRSSPGNTGSQNRRYDDLAAAIDALARATAVVLAHEVGHSLGLVANGAPPTGLFGGERNATFAGDYTNSFHLDTAANDIMASSLSFSAALATGSGAPRFNELCLAYLRERILLD